MAEPILITTLPLWRDWSKAPQSGAVLAPEPTYPTALGVPKESEWTGDAALEFHGSLSWEPVDHEQLRATLADRIPTELAAVSDWRAEDNGPTYSAIDQWLDAAKGQPGVVYGFMAGMGSPKVIVRYGDGGWEIGTPEAGGQFAGVDGNDGDNDEDDLPIIPSPKGGGTPVESTQKPLTVVSTVNWLLGESDHRETLSESEAEKIAKDLLGGKW